MSWIDEDIQAAQEDVRRAKDQPFDQLIKLAGLDPDFDLRLSDWSGVDFSGCDLRGFDFSGARLLGCRFDGELIEGARFDMVGAYFD